MLINYGFQPPESEQFGTLSDGMVQADHGTNGSFWRDKCRKANNLNQPRSPQKRLERPPKRTQQTQNHDSAALARGSHLCRHLRTHFNVLV